jgi:MoxR-like ATPase
LLDGRDFVLPDDVKELAYATLGHRIIVSPAARVKNVSAKEIIEQTLERIPVPGARARDSASFAAGDASQAASRTNR